MKKIFALILAILTISVVIAGCASNKNNQTTNTTTTENTSTTKNQMTTDGKESSSSTTGKPDEPVEKPTSAEALSAYIKALLKENSGKEIADIIGKLDTSPYFGDLSTEMEISPYPEGYAPFIRGFEYGTEFPEYVKSGAIYYIFKCRYYFFAFLSLAHNAYDIFSAGFNGNVFCTHAYPFTGIKPLLHFGNYCFRIPFIFYLYHYKRKSAAYHRLADSAVGFKKSGVFFDSEPIF